MQRSQQPRPEPPRIAGYRDLVRIANGGFSTVYTAYQETLSRTVAVKVLHADGQDSAARQRFQHECELTGRLTGRAHVITVFAAGTTEDGRFFIAMQYLPKGSLAERLATSGPMPAAEVIRIGVAVAGALATAHAAGILHRDIKPGNILISDQDEPVLSDFGIASLVNPVGDAKTVDAFTRGHTAPEVLDGQSPSAQSDLYAVGSTLYTLLTGVPPVGGPAGQLEPMSLNRPEIPAGLETLLRRTLAADPHQRPGSAAELGAALAALLGDQPVRPPALTPPAPAPAAAQPSGVAAVSLPVVEEPTRMRQSRILDPASAGSPKPSRRKLVIGAVVVAVAALVAAGSAFASTIGRTHEAVPVAAQSSRPGRSGSATPSTVVTGGASPGRSAGNPGSGSGGASPKPGASTPGQSPSAKPASPKPSTTKAAPPPPTACTTGGCAGKSYYVAVGDHLMVCDEKSDGLGVLAQYTRTDVPLQNNDAANKSGAGTCVDHNMNMATGVKITFRVCLTDAANKVSSCSAYITTSAQ